MNERTLTTAIMTRTVKSANGYRVLEQGDTVWIQLAVNQPDHFTKYFASPCSDSMADEPEAYTDHRGYIWSHGDDALLVEREDFRLHSAKLGGNQWALDRREREDQEAARLYREYAMIAETTVHHERAEWPHELMRAFLLGPVARIADQCPEMTVVRVDITKVEGWSLGTRVRVAYQPKRGVGMQHWDCTLSRFTPEVAR